jgi:hypothetical protein
MIWFNVYSPHWPLSGAVAQDIHPSLLAQAGDRGVEREVLSDVASYGKQLGVISDLVVKLASKVPPEQLGADGKHALEQLKSMVERIDAIKTRYARMGAAVNPPSPQTPSPPAPTSSSRRR